MCENGQFLLSWSQMSKISFVCVWGGGGRAFRWFALPSKCQLLELPLLELITPCSNYSVYSIKSVTKFNIRRLLFHVWACPQTPPPSWSMLSTHLFNTNARIKISQISKSETPSGSATRLKCLACCTIVL